MSASRAPGWWPAPPTGRPRVATTTAPASRARMASLSTFNAVTIFLSFRLDWRGGFARNGRPNRSGAARPPLYEHDLGKSCFLDCAPTRPTGRPSPRSMRAISRRDTKCMPLRPSSACRVSESTIPRRVRGGVAAAGSTSAAIGSGSGCARPEEELYSPFLGYLSGNATFGTAAFQIALPVYHSPPDQPGNIALELVSAKLDGQACLLIRVCRTARSTRSRSGAGRCP
jgi:hypothetical protein